VHTHTDVIDRRYDSEGDAILTVRVDPARAEEVRRRFHVLNFRGADGRG
jgi:predicted amidohydrolase